MLKKDEQQIIREFRVRQGRQFLAFAVTLLLVLLLTLIYRRPDLFGPVSSRTISAAQLAVIGGFMGFSALNWRCPACRKSLGGDIYRRICRKCGARLS